MRPWVDWVLVTSVLGLMAYRQALIATSNQRVLSALAETVRERTASPQWLSDHHEGILASVGEGVIVWTLLATSPSLTQRPPPR